MSTYSAGSASVQIVPDFSGAQRRIGEWFAGQRNIKMKVEPDVSQAGMAKARAELGALKADAKVGIDKKHLSQQMVQAVDFLTGTSTVAGALKKLFDVKPILMANLGGAGVAIASSLTSSLTSAIGGAAAMLPALSASLAIPAGTAMLGSAHIGDAFKNIGGTTPAQAKALAAAMKELAPSARDFVTQVHSLGPAFTAMRLDVQQQLFLGLGKQIKDLGNNALPMLRTHLAGVATELNGMGKALIGAINTPKNLADFATTIDNVKLAMHGITAAIAPLWSVFQNLATVGSGFLPGLTKGFGDLATKFADFIQHARDTGQLQTFIANAFNGLKDVVAVATNAASVLKSVFTAALPSGQVLIGILKVVTGDLAAFFKTDLAQSSLHTFFEGLTTAIGALTPGLTSLVSALVTSVLPAMSGLAQAIAPVVNSLGLQFADLLRTLGPLFYPALAGAISTALGALTPLIGVFSHLASAVLPLVITAIQKLAPLLSTLAEGVGQALTRAIDALLPALPPIISAFQALVQALVPFDLTVANLAVSILPPFVAILKGVAETIQFLAPLLPLLIGGLAAMKLVGPLSTMFGALSEKILAAAIATDTMSTSTTGLARRGLTNVLTNAAGGAEKAANAAKGFGTALGVVGVAVGAVTMIMQASKQQTDDFAQALLKGGQAAHDAAAQMANPSIWDQVKFAFGHVFSSAGWNTNSISENMTAEAKKTADAMFKAMDPLQQAQQKQAQWQAELTYRMGKYGEGSAEVEAAQRRLTVWTAEVARQQQIQGDATKTATERLKEQADQMQAQHDAVLAEKQAILGVHSAMDDYNKVMKDGKATDDDRTRSTIAVQQAIEDAATAAQKRAEAEYKGADAGEKTRLGVQAYIDALKAQSANLTGPAADAMNAYIADYERLHGTAAQAQAQVQDLGLTVVNMPDSKTIVVSAPTADQEEKLRQLGFDVQHLPNGMVQINTDTGEARKELQDFIDTVNKANPTVKVNVRTIGNTVVSVGGMGGLNAGSIAGGAIGGIVKPMAAGGINTLFMSGKVASVVKPNTWRVIGDRVRDDEAFIPINGSSRSQQILSQTASRMGYGLTRNAQGNLLMPPGADSVYSGNRDYAMATSLRDQRGVDAGMAATVNGFVNNGTVLTVDPDELARKSRLGTQRALAVAGL